MRECQAFVARIPLPLPLLCHCSPQRCCRCHCCGDASTSAPRRSGEKQFQQKNENLICLLQELWIDRHGHPPALPDFDTFSPTPLKPKYVKYVRRIPGLTTTTTFTSQDTFLGTTITSTQNSKTTTFTLFNFYSPGRAETIARLLPTIPVPKECILMEDLNAHHLWWQGPLPQTACTLKASHSLAEWLESNNFQPHNEPGLLTHHPRNGTTPSMIDLCLSQRDISASILSLATNHNTTSDHSSITVRLALPSSRPALSAGVTGTKQRGKLSENTSTPLVST